MTSQFLGWRFRIDGIVEITRIGGHLSRLQGGNRRIFAAIVKLDGPTAFPLGTPFGPTMVAVTTFDPGSPSSDVRASLSVRLGPGDYALVFGSGLFGATGEAVMPSNNGDIPGRASYLSWVGSLVSWSGCCFGGTRFVVEGNILSSEGTADLQLGATTSAAPETERNSTSLTLAVSNAGPTRATGVTLSESFPGDVIVDSIVPSQGSCAGANFLTCALGDINVGATATVEIVVTLDTSGAFTHIAKASANEPDLLPSNNVVAQWRSADLFPLLPEATWTYLKNGSVTSTTKLLDGTTNVEGVETFVLEESDDRSRYFVTVNSDGVHLHRRFLPDVLVEGRRGRRANLTLTFSPPVRLMDRVAKLGQTVSSNGLLSVSGVPAVGKVEVPYDASFGIQTVHEVMVPSGSFQAARLFGTIGVNLPGLVSFTFDLAEKTGVAAATESYFAKANVKDELLTFDLTKVIQLVSTNIDVHDLAVTKITAPKTVTLIGGRSQTKQVKVEIQNRSPHSETIQDMDILTDVVKLEVKSLDIEMCPDIVPLLRPPMKPFPITLKPKQKITVVFDVTFDCVNASRKGPSQEDFRHIATVDHAAPDGQADIHPEDDVCPRNVTPPFEVDPNPDGTIKDKGCGNKKPDRTLGADVLTDVVMK